MDKHARRNKIIDSDVAKPSRPRRYLPRDRPNESHLQELKALALSRRGWYPPNRGPKRQSHQNKKSV